MNLNSKYETLIYKKLHRKKLTKNKYKRFKLLFVSHFFFSLIKNQEQRILVRKLTFKLYRHTESGANLHAKIHSSIAKAIKI